MFHLLKLASANSQVTLVTSSGAFKNLSFRKVWFYLVKPLLLGANVCKTLRPARCRPHRPLDPGRTLAGAFCALFRTFCTFWAPWRVFSRNLDALVEVFSFLLSILRFSWFFLLFGPLRDPPGHQKTMKIIVLSLKINVSLISKNVVPGTTFGAIWAHFWVPFGRFWPPSSVWQDCSSSA